VKLFRRSRIPSRKDLTAGGLAGAGAHRSGPWLSTALNLQLRLDANLLRKPIFRYQPAEPAIPTRLPLNDGRPPTLRPISSAEATARRVRSPRPCSRPVSTTPATRPPVSGSKNLHSSGALCAAAPAITAPRVGRRYTLKIAMPMSPQTTNTPLIPLSAVVCMLLRTLLVERPSALRNSELWFVPFPCVVDSGYRVSMDISLWPCTSCEPA